MRRKLPPIGAEFGQPHGQAAVRQRAVLRTVEAIHAAGVVARGQLRTARRRRRVVFAAAAGDRLVLAGLGRLQQREAKFAIGRHDLVRLRRPRRHPAIGRIDDQRRALPGALDRLEHRVVRAGDVELGAALDALVAAQQLRSLLVQIGPLFLGEELLVRVARRALQGRVGFIGPDALQVGIAPWRLHRLCRGRGLRRGGDRDDDADGERRDGDTQQLPPQTMAHDGLLHCSGSSSAKPDALSLVAGSGPFPSANARSSNRAALMIVGKPIFPSMQRGSE